MGVVGDVVHHHVGDVREVGAGRWVEQGVVHGEVRDTQPGMGELRQGTQRRMLMTQQGSVQDTFMTQQGNQVEELTEANLCHDMCGSA